MHRRQFCRSALIAGGALALAPVLRAATGVDALTVDAKQLSIGTPAIEELRRSVGGELRVSNDQA